MQPQQCQGIQTLFIAVPSQLMKLLVLLHASKHTCIRQLFMIWAYNIAHICDESQIVHATACILRRQISDITISDDKCPAPEEVSILNSDAKLPSSLKTFMLDDSAFSKRYHFARKASKMFILSKMHCVCKQKHIYLFPFGGRITGSPHLWLWKSDWDVAQSWVVCILPRGKTLSYKRCWPWN